MANQANKQALIDLLVQRMVEVGISVQQAEANAICRLACLSAKDRETAVIAEDSDIFQLLTYHVKPRSSNVYMVTSKQTMCINTLKLGLTPSISSAILFLHAMSGCDTTSRLFGVGKVTVLAKHAALQKSADVFMLPTSSKKDIETAGEEALLVIYGCTSSVTLDAARVTKFLQKVATSTQYVSPEKLPPTSDAAAFHSYRT